MYDDDMERAPLCSSGGQRTRTTFSSDAVGCCSMQPKMMSMRCLPHSSDMFVAGGRGRLSSMGVTIGSGCRVELDCCALSTSLTTYRMARRLSGDGDERFRNCMHQRHQNTAHVTDVSLYTEPQPIRQQRRHEGTGAKKKHEKARLLPGRHPTP